MKNILAVVDFSEITRRIVEQAASQALAFNAHLTLVHVAAPDPSFVGYDAGQRPVVRDERARELRDEHRVLAEFAEELRSRGVDAGAHLIQGPTVETILEQAEKTKADLIVMGSHGYGAFYRAVLGSVSESVLRKAPCPVLLIPARLVRD